MKIEDIKQLIIKHSNSVKKWENIDGEGCLTEDRWIDEDDINNMANALFSLFNNHNNHKSGWSIGERVMVTDCIYGHGFKDGEIVEILQYDGGSSAKWLCSNSGKISWWLSEDEGIIVT